MQNRKIYSLNGIRVFNEVARTNGVQSAATNLSLTPGAISHQLKKLEQDLEIALFERGNNSISLTPEGRRLYETSGSALAHLDRVIEELKGNERDINIRCQISLAVRWLIPALEHLKQKYPDIRVRVETRWDRASPVSEQNNFSIAFNPITSKPPEGRLLYRDFSRPVASPSYLDGAKFTCVEDIYQLTLIGAAKHDWDWKHWCELHSLSFAELNIGLRTDTDDAGIHAAVAGMGVTLAPEIMTRKEIASGSLVELPFLLPVELGGYYLQSSSFENRTRRQVLNWLVSELEPSGQSSG